MRKIQESEVTFTIEAEQDDIPVRGQFASGDDEQDKRDEDEILRRLDSGDIWAWASVCVKATLTMPDGSTAEGRDYLGCCSYANEADFKSDGGYYSGMKIEALADLQRELEAEVARGALIAQWFKE